MKLQQIPNPNFMIIGAQKAGTTWLHRMIQQHPEIYFADKKELHFFNLMENYSKGFDWYRQNFITYNGEHAIGEATPNYLWICTNEREIKELGVIPNIPQLIHSHYPDLRLIVTLREPVSRAVSAYYHFLRSRKVPLNSSILDVGQTNGIISMGFYQSHILEWLKYYPLDHFLFLVYEEDIIKNRYETFSRTFRFLDVDDAFVPDNIDKRWNKRSGHLHIRLKHYSPKTAYYFFKAFPSLKQSNFPQIKLDENDLQQLAKLYAEKNRDLADIIQRKLPYG